MMTVIIKDREDHNSIIRQLDLTFIKYYIQLQHTHCFQVHMLYHKEKLKKT